MCSVTKDSSDKNAEKQTLLEEVERLRAIIKSLDKETSETKEEEEAVADFILPIKAEVILKIN